MKDGPRFWLGRQGRSLYRMMNIAPLCFVTVALCLLVLTPGMATPAKEQHGVLSAAESLFRMMKEGNYSRIWFYLSVSSRNSIIDSTYKNIVKYEKERGRETVYSRDQIGNDFLTGGVVAQAYWKSYLEAFNPDIVLEQSRWELGMIETDRAQIYVKYKKAERPAVIQMYKEEGYWKVGLIETFKATKH